MSALTRTSRDAGSGPWRPLTVQNVLVKAGLVLDVVPLDGTQQQIVDHGRVQDDGDIDQAAVVYDGDKNNMLLPALVGKETMSDLPRPIPTMCRTAWRWYSKRQVLGTPMSQLNAAFRASFIGSAGRGTNPVTKDRSRV
ncbi:hypothetical protein G7054_g14684 [Neopestalotiopsis clavispora]|nr:hypothetical protein G7054_g14684 [Neopestalotiopsis clavispora]